MDNAFPAEVELGYGADKSRRCHAARKAERLRERDLGTVPCGRYRRDESGGPGACDEHIGLRQKEANLGACESGNPGRRQSKELSSAIVHNL